MTRVPQLILLAGSISLFGGTQAVGQQICRPALSIKEVRFSEMQPPTFERKWTAMLSVDASACATNSGRFQIVFSRLKEIGIDLEFREQFIWKPVAVEVSLDFWSDEAVAEYRLGEIAPCPCRNWANTSENVR